MLVTAEAFVKSNLCSKIATWVQGRLNHNHPIEL